MRKTIETFLCLFFLVTPKAVLADSHAPADKRPKQDTKALACLQSICGTVKEAEPLVAKYVVRLKKMFSEDHPLPEEVERKFRELRELTALQKKFLQTLVEEVASIPKFKISESNAAFYRLVKSSSLARQAKFGVSPDGKVVLDESATRQELLKSMSKEEVDSAIKMIKFEIESMISSSEPEIRQLPPSLILGSRYPGKSVEAAFEEELEKARKNSEEIKKLPLVWRIGIFSNITQKIEDAAAGLKSKKLSEEQMRNILLINTQVPNFVRLIAHTKDNPLYQGKTPSSDNLFKQIGKKKLSSNVAHLTTREDLRISNCILEYKKNLEFLPDRDGIETLKGDIQHSKKLVQDQLLPRYSEKTRKMLLSMLGGIQFALPRTKEEFQKSFSEHLETEISGLKSQSEAFSAMGREDLKGFILMLGFIPDKESEDSDLDETGFCSSYQFRVLSDNTRTGLNGIQVSATTASARPETRRMVLMHEIGHAISASMKPEKASELSLGRFKKTRKCLEKPHHGRMPPGMKEALEKVPESIRPKENELYDEEDYADGVAAISGKQEYSSNPICQLMDANLERGDYASPSLINQGSDSHSSVFFRILNSEFLIKGKFPPACVEYTKAEKIEFTDCFQE